MLSQKPDIWKISNAFSPTRSAGCLHICLQLQSVPTGMWLVQYMVSDMVGSAVSNTVCKYFAMMQLVAKLNRLFSYIWVTITQLCLLPYS